MLQYVLTLAASILIGHHTPVYCNPPPQMSGWPDGDVGFESHTIGPDTTDDQIYLRYCDQTIALKRKYVDAFAHEILHAKHHDWDHPQIYAKQHSYGRVVTKLLRRLERPKER